MPNTTIQSLIQSFAAQLEAAAKKAAIAQVIASLGGGAAPARRGRPKGSKNVAKTGTSRPSQDMGPALLGYVRANPGSRADQIAKALRTTPDKMRKFMQTLLDSKQVKRSGVRRGTTYNVAGATPIAAAPKQATKARRAKRGRKQAAPAQSTRQRLVGLSAMARK